MSQQVLNGLGDPRVFVEDGPLFSGCKHNSWHRKQWKPTQNLAIKWVIPLTYAIWL